METEISLKGLNHDQYFKLIKYMGKEENRIRQKGTRKSENIYDIYETGKGNSENIKYNLNIKVKSALEEFPEDSEKIKESLKGLVDLLYS